MTEKPVWVKFEKGIESQIVRCHKGEHTWFALFYKSGGLAYWKCVDCGKSDRQIEQLSERLDYINSWIKTPPELIARGDVPPVSIRKWVTSEGDILVEGDPSSIHFVGLVIPGLDEAHSYVGYGKDKHIKELYNPSRERHGKYSDHYTLMRYQVIGTALVQFRSHCFEESTYDTPNAGKPKKKKILSGLRLLLD